MRKNIGVTSEQRWNKYVEASGLLDKIGENQTAEKKGTAEQKHIATKFLRKTVYDSIPQSRKPDSVEAMNPNEYESNYKVVLIGTEEKATSNFREALKDLGNINKARGALEEIAGTAEIMDRLSEDDRGLVEYLANYKGIKRLAKKYDSGSSLSEDERKTIRAAGAKGFADNEVKKLKETNKEAEEKYSDAFYEAIRTASQIGVVSKRVNPTELESFVKGGLDKLSGKAKKEYEKALGDDKDRIYQIIGRAVRAWAEESPREFGKVEDAMYRAKRGKLYK